MCLHGWTIAGQRICTCTVVPQIIPGDNGSEDLAETVIRRDADAEPPRMGSRRVSARCSRFMSVVNNGFRHMHWHRVMNCVSPPKTRRRPIHGGSNPASMRDTVFGGDTQSMPLTFVGQRCMYRTYGSRVTLVRLPWRNCRGCGIFAGIKNIKG